MKKALFLFLFIFSLLAGHAQSGLFMTYKDYKSGKIAEDLGELVAINNMGRRFQVVFKKKGEKRIFINLKKKDIWGFTDGERIFRVGFKKMPYVLLIEGKIVAWGNHTSKFTKNGLEADDTREFPFFFSSSVDGEMTVLTRKKLLKTLKKGSKPYKELKRNGYNLAAILEFIGDYNAGKFD